MLWINQRNVTDYDGSRHVEHDVHITRGDSGYLELVPVQNGEPYTPQESDTITLQVRAKPIKGDAETELLFNGLVTVENGVPVWHITTANTTRDCGTYFWDVQLNSGGEVSTYAMGKFVVEEENTL